MIQTVDAAAFQKMVIHAAAALNSQKQALNDLNVFPVPDGDTGTNMGLTIASASTVLQQKQFDTVGQAAAAVASALLRGARGNSGVILSLLFRGFAKAIREKDVMDGTDFAVALDMGVAAAYKAVMKPAEGTILTVSRLAGVRAGEAAQEDNNLQYVLEAAITEGEIALADTVNQNPVLKKAGVVDAGGKGFLVILEGMLASLKGEAIPEVDDTVEIKEQAAFGQFSTEEITFGYCTEFIAARENDKDPELLRKFIAGMGDSQVMVADDDIIKVHVHTNDPGLVLQEGLTYGQLLTMKIENMREQHTAITEGTPVPVAAEPQKAVPEKTFGFVAVCAGDGLEAVFRDLGADGVISGGQTMNPSTEDILKEIDKTPAEIVYVLPNNKNIIMAAQQCVSIVEDKKVVVIPTKTVPQGIAAMLMVEPDGTEEGNTEVMTEAAGRVSTAEITYAARNSDFDGFAINEGDYLALQEHQLFGTDKDIYVMLERLAQSQPQQDAEFITVFYGEDVSEEDGQKALELFEKHCPNAEINLIAGGQPVYYYMISAE